MSLYLQLSGHSQLSAVPPRASVSWSRHVTSDTDYQTRSVSYKEKKIKKIKYEQRTWLCILAVHQYILMFSESTQSTLSMWAMPLQDSHVVLAHCQWGWNKKKELLFHYFQSANKLLKHYCILPLSCSISQECPPLETGRGERTG